jgi:hypothetical protein
MAEIGRGMDLGVWELLAAAAAAMTWAKTITREIERLACVGALRIVILFSREEPLVCCSPDYTSWIIYCVRESLSID